MRGRLLCAVLVALLLPAWSAGAEPVSLKASLQGPLTDPYFGVSLARFKEEVERRSKGTLSVQIFDKGQLYRDDQVVGAVSSGAVDIGITAAHNYAEKVPAVGILDQPFLFNFPALVRAVAAPDSEIRKLIDQAILAQAGVRILWWQSLGDNVFYSNGRDVAEPGRLKGQRVGAPGRTLAAFLARCGATASVVSVEKIPAAIKEGRLDMALIALAALRGLELWKVTDTITRTAHAPLEFLLGINETTWQALSPSHRALVAEVARQVEREARDRESMLEGEVYALASTKGVKIRDLTPDQVVEWRACSAEMLADYMDRNGEIAHRLMAAYAKLRTLPCCTAGPGSSPFTRR